MKPKKMTKVEMRVAVAKDVIKMVKDGQITAERGSYFESNFQLHPIGRLKRFFKNIFFNRMMERAEGDLLASASLKDAIPSMLSEASCQVCARGAAFLAYVKRFNKVKIGQFFDSDGNVNDDKSRIISKRKSRELFGAKNVQFIEVAFEGDPRRCPSNRLRMAEKVRAVQFYEAIPGGDDRLIAIMKNIIANEGTFKP